MKCLIDSEIDCSLQGNSDGAYCWACNPDCRAEEKLRKLKSGKKHEHTRVY